MKFNCNGGDILEALVSVIVAIYKVDEYLKQCIISLESQTYTNVEIILVDDGSPDEMSNYM